MRAWSFALIFLYFHSLIMLCPRPAVRGCPASVRSVRTQARSAGRRAAVGQEREAAPGGEPVGQTSDFQGRYYIFRVSPSLCMQAHDPAATPRPSSRCCWFASLALCLFVCLFFVCACVRLCVRVRVCVCVGWWMYVPSKPAPLTGRSRALALSHTADTPPIAPSTLAGSCC
jgi:hypothetical protein